MATLEDLLDDDMKQSLENAAKQNRREKTKWGGLIEANESDDDE